MRRALLVACLTVAACQPSPQTPSESFDSAQSLAKSSVENARDQEVPLPVQIFEMHCYRPSADFKTIVGAAEALKLKPIPKELEPLMAPEEGGGRGFVVKLEKADGKVMKAILLGVSPRNTCSVYANGYNAEVVLTSARETYQLFSIMRDDIGLQVNEMFVPGGKSKQKSEAREKGVIAVMISKPKSGGGDAITLSYISPDTAKQLFH